MFPGTRSPSRIRPVRSMLSAARPSIRWAVVASTFAEEEHGYYRGHAFKAAHPKEKPRTSSIRHQPRHLSRKGLKIKDSQGLWPPPRLSRTLLCLPSHFCPTSILKARKNVGPFRLEAPALTQSSIHSGRSTFSAEILCCN